ATARRSSGLDSNRYLSKYSDDFAPERSWNVPFSRATDMIPAASFVRSTAATVSGPATPCKTHARLGRAPLVERAETSTLRGSVGAEICWALQRIASLSHLRVDSPSSMEPVQA